MNRSLFKGIAVTLGLIGAGTSDAQTDVAGFTSENAVLDTSIPFTIGAREARQELRGAFGWPTFQEGLVEGVYFRFDPDGYARFAPTPRLDTDIFEVICRPRTLSCMGRKNTLTIFLNSRGQFELKIDDVVEGDQLFLSEGVSEIQLPDSVLMPLTPQLETLLASGGEITVKRDGNEKARISLTGFGAVSAYLRWVAASQDYTVLPRGWPVPNTTELSAGSLTQPQSWASPMPQPQAPFGSPGGYSSTEVSEIRGELADLRNLLLKRSAQEAVPAAAGAPGGTETPGTADLQQQILFLQRQLQIARMNDLGVPQEQAAAPQAAAPQAEEAPSAGEEDAAAAEVPPPMDEGARLAQQIAYLITEIGLDPQTAVMLLQMRESPHEQTRQAITEEDGVVNRLLAELGLGMTADGKAGVVDRSASIAPGVTGDPVWQSPPGQVLDPLARTTVHGVPAGAAGGQAASMTSPISTGARDEREHMLLTDYFRSIVDPAAVPDVPPRAQGTEASWPPR